MQLPEGVSVPRFLRDAAGKVHLRTGDLTFLAGITNRSVDHIGRCLRGERTPSPLLALKLEALIGVKLEHVIATRRPRRPKEG